MAKMFRVADGQEVEVPDDQVQAAFQSKQYGFAKDSKIPIVNSDDDEAITVSPTELSKAFKGGWSFLPQGEAEKRALEKKYGGLGYGLAAAIAEGARIPTLGLSDVVARGAATAIGGDQLGEKTAKALLDIKKSHPYASLAGGVVGAALPLILSGGAAAPVEGAELLAEGAVAGKAAIGGAEALEAATVGAPKIANLANQSVDAQLALGNVIGAGEETSAIGRGVVSLARAVNAPNEAATYAGEFSKAAVESLLGTGSSTKLATIAKKAISSGAGMAVEGAIYGAGNEISEVTLGDHELAGSKLATSMLEGGLFGAVLGSGTSLIGSGGRALLEKASPTLRKLGAEQTVRSLVTGGLSPVHFIKKMEKLEGGIEGVGTEIAQRNLIRPLDTVETMAPRLREEANRVGAESQQLLRDAGLSDVRIKSTDSLPLLLETVQEKYGSTPSLSKEAFNVLRATQKDMVTLGDPLIQDRVHNLLGGAMKFDRLMDVLLETNAMYEPTALAALKKMAKEEPVFARLFSAKDDLAAQKIQPWLDAIEDIKSGTELSFEQMREFKSQMGGKIDWLTHPLKPISVGNEAKKDIYWTLDDILERGLDRAADKLTEMGHQVDLVAKMRELNLSYARLNAAAGQAEDSLTRMRKNATFSLGTKILGGAVLGAALGEGADHPGEGAVAGAAAGLMGGRLGHVAAAAAESGIAMGVHKLFKEHGTATAAYALNKVADLTAVKKAMHGEDMKLGTEFRRWADGLVSKSPIKTVSKDQIDTSYKLAEKEVKAAAADPVGLSQVALAKIGTLVHHAPRIAAAYLKSVSRAATFLASALPKKPPPATLQPQFEKDDQIPVEQKERFLRQYRVVRDPSIVLKKMQAGTLVADEVEALKAAHLNRYEEIKAKIMEHILEPGSPKLAYEQSLQLHTLWGIPTHPTLTPEFVAKMQGAFNQTQSSKSQAAPERIGSPKRPIVKLENSRHLREFGGRGRQ